MKKKLLWAVLAGLVLLVVGLSPVFLIISGKIRNEQFFRGRPTSYWKREIKKWETSYDIAPPQVKLYRRARVFLNLNENPEPTILAGDAAAEPVLLELRCDGDAGVRFHAIKALAKLPPKPSLISVFREALEDESFVVRMAATRGLDARGTVNDLLLALRNCNEHVRFRALHCLQQRGPQARTAVPALEAALQDPAALVRLKAALALWHVDNQVRIEELLAALGDEENWVRQAVAASYLGDFGTEARAAIPGLQTLRHHKYAGAHEAAKEALRKIDPRALKEGGAENCP
jgi:HEAT repeat protein